MNFRNRVNELCAERGITQKNLAERIGITTVGLNQCLRNDYPSLQSLEKICNALNVPISELFETSVLRCPHCGKRLMLVEYPERQSED